MTTLPFIWVGRFVSTTKCGFDVIFRLQALILPETSHEIPFQSPIFPCLFYVFPGPRRWSWGPVTWFFGPCGWFFLSYWTNKSWVVEYRKRVPRDVTWCHQQVSESEFREHDFSAVRSLLGGFVLLCFPPSFGMRIVPSDSVLQEIKACESHQPISFIRKKCVESVSRWPLYVERWCQMVAAAIDSLAQRAAFVIFCFQVGRSGFGFTYRGFLQVFLTISDQATGVIVSAHSWVGYPIHWIKKDWTPVNTPGSIPFLPIHLTCNFTMARKKQLIELSHCIPSNAMKNHLFCWLPSGNLT